MPAFDWGVDGTKPWYVVNHNLVRGEPYPGLR